MNRVKIWIVFLGLGSMSLGVSCQNASRQVTAEHANLPTGDNSMTSLDWAGTYVGELPCADCPGIRSVLMLSEDLTYRLNWIYEEKGDQVMAETGSFTWNADGSGIQLNGDSKTQYQVGEGKLFQLDTEGNKMEGALAEHFVFHKKEIGLRDTPWKLVEVEGVKRSDYPTSGDPHIQFIDERIIGTSGCNRLSGSFSRIDSNLLSLSAISSTRMACPEMQLENLVQKVLSNVHSYSLNGDRLFLSNAEKKVILEFEADFLIKD